ncbi:MAG: type 4a pilus biogenesis protein PilO [Elusimicrobia bacterium]|nr:type 4a pilus biogenesis protein PilO [Elusimicrobiota bacterium]
MALKINLQLTKQQQQQAAVAVVLVGVGLFFYVKKFWIPTSDRIKEAQTKIEEVEKKITKARGEAARLDKIKAELVLLDQQAQDAELRLPKIKDVPAVIDTVSQLAKQNRVNLVTFAPTGTSSKQYFVEVPYSMVVSGSYHDLGRFFAGLALEDRIYGIRNVAFSGPADSVTGRINVTFILVSYQYKG